MVLSVLDKVKKVTQTCLFCLHLKETELMDFLNTFCGKSFDACLNHTFLLSVDSLLLIILLVVLACNVVSLRKFLCQSKCRRVSKLSICSVVFNGCLGLGYIVLGAWKLKEQLHDQEYQTFLPLHRWLAFLVHGITWLFVSSIISLYKQQLFLIVKLYSILALLLAGFLCITSVWKCINYDHVIGGEVIVDALSLLGAILLICSGFKESDEYGNYEGIDLCDETFYKPLQCEDGISNETTPFANAGFLGKFSFWWLNPLMQKGKKKTLEDEDVPQLRSADGAGTCFNLFNEQLNILKRKDPLRKPSILMALLLCQQKEIFISGIFALIKTLTLTTGPLFLHTFIEVSEGKEAFKYEGYALTAGFFLAKCSESLAQRQWCFRSRLIGLQVKSSLTAAIFQKQLQVSNAAKTTHSPGQIMNYVTVDAHKIGEFPFWFHQIWTTILQLVLVLCLIYYSIGVAASAALVIVILIVLVNSPLAKLQLKYQINLMIAQDKRLKAITEALTHMKVLKLYSWEKHFLNEINKLRSEETKWLSLVQTQKGYYLILFWSSPILVSSATFVACYLFGVPLNVSNVFTFLASLNLLQDPIRRIPDVVGAFIEAKVSLSRIVKFLEEPDMVRRDHMKQTPDDLNIYINCTDVSWEMNFLNPALRDINLEIKHGEKVAVCGEVGSGKSTLMSLILGEVPYINGTVKVYGKTAYVSQTAWIQTGTIKENILFGSNMEPQRYRQALVKSSLVKDLEMLPFGDLTEIGERGNNLSGGQKQRVQLARALYQDADIYLLDDPFSAVDAHTSTNLFNDYVMGALSGKTVLLVTHQVEFLPTFDSILLISCGKILKSGTFDELLSQSEEFQELVNAQKTPSGPKCEEIYATKRPKVAEIEINNVSSDECGVVSLKGDQLIKAEEREVGDAGMKPYIQYLKHYKGFLYFSLAVIAHTMFVVGQYIQSYKLATDLQNSSVSRLKLITVYTIIGLSLLLFLLLRSLLTVKLGLGASKSIFCTLSSSLFFAPMSFFDSTPFGRILSRVSSDLSTVDIELPFLINFTVGSIIISYSTYVILCFLAPEVLLAIVLMIYVTILVQRYYNASAKELMRLNGTTKSLVANHLAESISGITTIRSFGQEGRFFVKNLEFIDKNARPFFHTFSATEWLILLLEIMCAVIMSSWMLGMTSLHIGSSVSGLIGMAFSYGLSLNTILVWSVQCECTIANSIISVERLEQYMRLPSEATEVGRSNHTLPGWPTRGKVEIRDLKVRYRPNGPLVLQGISCTFEGGQKIGVVGRTGSGKTTLISALFRLVEPTDGKIIIDDRDISTLRLHDLRSRIGIIPQDPTLFTGSVRYNLDPLSEYSDDQIWKVLEKCQLREAVQGKETGLDSSVLQDGSNWSMGQRQLFCLGRALLKRSRILVLDEATASIDNATDAILQKIIRLEFVDCTVITVAHRIPTVMDYTKVLAISDGKLVEFDEPKKLISKDGSLFGELVKEYWARAEK
ncbi:ABC transporter C family member 10-like [Nicotiana tabacum]|uniref:ABC transporter C family member 10-like n=1 Tax=Nicotiana tabacum TaxID=4097 RepID=UPI003F4E7572